MRPRRAEAAWPAVGPGPCCLSHLLLELLGEALGALAQGIERPALAVHGAIGIALAERAVGVAHGVVGIAEIVAVALPALPWPC